MLALDGFNDALRGAYDKRMPHILCDHAYTLAQAFSGFYAAAPILVESDAREEGLAACARAGDAEAAGNGAGVDRDRDAGAGCSAGVRERCDDGPPTEVPGR